MTNNIQNSLDSIQKSSLLLDKIQIEPPYSECARVGARALYDGNMPILRHLTKNFDFFDRKNLQLEHQQIIFSQSKDNIGLMGTNGSPELFSENLETKNYTLGECLDGSIIRKAIKNIGIPKAYAWLGYNCQEYVTSIKKQYNSIIQSSEKIFCSVLGSY